MKDSKYTGTGVAIITPFKNQKVDFDALTTVVNHVIRGGVDYIVALGSTGETATLNDQEAKAVLDHVIKINEKRVPIVAGNFASNNTLDLCEKISNYDFKGIDALLISSPAYVKPSQEGIYHHFMALQEVSPLPIILYNVPGRTMSNMSWTTTVRLARDSKKFIGIKEASGDLIQATRIIKNRPDNFFVTSGDDEVAMAMVACGGEGVISVMANAFPLEFSQMIGAALAYDFTTAQKINLELYDLHKWLYIEGNPVGIKSAMKVLGICENDVRLPLHPLSVENYNNLKQEMERIQRLIA
ncbi:4-hydroxy-tetrahydrodipicolinate synthase [Portibacter lacus]|uniref:4-hydroxy-tetrahydrodipicolinate synthase n=1 Tax=Portibacter lacus TaxID=1099794 RepID=A0AA37WGS4_9BACT|nr:4-hydroxy-tetrahydrodipicolinate synthase [Portibacter lacus]GLR18060.1 4-hydroxy-tetrahydrodipicolinate synthase [Portibacter lacus]